MEIPVHARWVPPPWVVWTMTGIAALLLIAALVLAAMLRWRAPRLVALAPTAGLVMTVIGWAPEAQRQKLATQGFERMQREMPDALRPTLVAALERPSARGLRAAQAVLGQYGWHRPHGIDICALLRPHLSHADRDLRSAARECYRVQRNALTWCAERQQPDGGWPAAQAPMAPGYVPGAVGVTSLALLSYLGAGYDHRMPSAFKKQVLAGIRWLVAQRDAQGRFSPEPHDHALATMVVAEAYAMSNDPSLKGPAQSGIDLSAAAGLPAADSLLLVLETMAAKSAAAGGLRADEVMRARRDLLLTLWPHPSAGDPPWLVGGAPQAIDEPAAAAAAAVVLCLTGDRAGPGPLSIAVASATRAQPPGSQRSPVTAWFTVLGAFQHGGKAWNDWQHAARQRVFDAQILGVDGLDGAWPTASGHPGDQTAVTALTMLTMEVWYRYIPNP